MFVKYTVFAELCTLSAINLAKSYTDFSFKQEIHIISSNFLRIFLSKLKRIYWHFFLFRIDWS